MSYPDWREPLRLLRATTGPPNGEQRELARLIGLTLPPDEPTTLAAARLADALCPTLGMAAPQLASLAQLGYLADLPSAESVTDTERLTHRVASAWIGHFLDLRTMAALERLRPARGDLVAVRFTPRGDDVPGPEQSQTRVVSSVSADGRLNLKDEPRDPGNTQARLLRWARGDNRRTAWPHWVDEVFHSRQPAPTPEKESQ